MHAFKRVTENFEFDLKTTEFQSLIITLKGNFKKSDRIGDTGEFKAVYARKEDDKEVIIYLEIYNFLEVMKQRPKYITENTLSCFSHTFKNIKDSRQQLIRSLKYFVLAEYYGVLKAAFPKEVLNAADKKYKEAVKSLPDDEKTLKLYQVKADKHHITAPLVASTGLIVYATENYNWFIREIDKKHKSKPEYLRSLTEQSGIRYETSTLNDSLLIGTEKQCQEQVIKLQNEAYGLSWDKLKKQETKVAFTQKLIDDLEILLDIPISETLQAKLEAKEKEEALKEKTDISAAQLRQMVG